MKGQTYIILALIFALLIAIFAVINVDAVQVNYLFGTGEAPLILVILISVLLGGLATASVGAIRYYRLKRENKSLRAQLDAPADVHTNTDEPVHDPAVNDEQEENSKLT
ncbi:lipopolysaccharide assembly protein LapA domain-containing protein [Halobacillus sp. ACCC02827]|uniref:LapA family protein n=1 Tax=Halobacillus sp. ACCC02827 TaxID=3052090 RepID=UPI0025710BBE|nr:lipopolysaccharide assembly protein LapA domain-containing protein [Halobacillus sp. ACCC02827]WJE14498.1 lipopolysaccharide assembly protein LapA domain-containing protein [Halobacillus sp. ACCC02827]